MRGFAAGIVKTVDLVGFVVVVVNTALAVNARYFLVTFLGKGTEKWIPALFCLQILCVYGAVRAVIEPLGPCLTARGQTKILWKATILAGTVELVSLLLILHTGRIELVAFAVLLAYITQVIVYIPHLRQDLSLGLEDILSQIWPMLPAAAAGYLLTEFLPPWLGSTFFTLGLRGLFTATVVALTHGLFTKFRFFHEAGGMISQNFARLEV